MRDKDNWDKKAQINEQFFRLQHMFLKLDKRLKDNYDVLNKSINYQQSMLGDRIKNLSVFMEEKLKDMEDVVNGTKR